jgi:major membrane immunogen (membrane-anchored lipoprotein)
MKKLILVLMLSLSLIGCKKRVDYEREQAEAKGTPSLDDNVWTVTTTKGTYQGHKIEIEQNNLLNFVTDDGKKIYTTAPWQIEAQAK